MNGRGTAGDDAPRVGAPLGSERHWIESQPLKRALVRWWGWRQLGPRIRYWQLARAVQALRPQRILEAGCGWGQNLFALQRRWPEARCIGVDVEAAALQTAQHIAAHLAGRRPQFVRADLHALPLRGSCDLVVLMDVLEYLRDDRAVLRQCRALLAPAGRLIVHAPRRLDAQRRYVPVSHAVPGHVRPEYTREELVEVVRAAGFLVEEVRATFGCWATLAWECGKLSERCRPLGVVCFPLLLLLARCDVWCAPREGNGFLLIAMPGAADG